MSNAEFDKLIDRLRVCSEINHPSRPWSDEGYAAIKFAWSDKRVELKERVESLEKEIIQRKDHLSIVKD